MKLKYLVPNCKVERVQMENLLNGASFGTSEDSQDASVSRPNAKEFFMMEDDEENNNNW